MTRRIVGTAGMLAATLVAAAGLVREFVVGPGMLGSPADDPMVGYSSVALDRKLNSPDYDFTRKEIEALRRRESAATERRAQGERGAGTGRMN